MNRHLDTGGETERDWDEPFDLPAQGSGPTDSGDGTIHGLLQSLAETVFPPASAESRPRAKKTAAPKWSDLNPEDFNAALLDEVGKMRRKLNEIKTLLQTARVRRRRVPVPRMKTKMR
jgi:hypothetical protein